MCINFLLFKKKIIYIRIFLKIEMSLRIYSFEYTFLEYIEHFFHNYWIAFIRDRVFDGKYGNFFLTSLYVSIKWIDNISYKVCKRIQCCTLKKRRKSVTFLWYHYYLYFYMKYIFSGTVIIIFVSWKGIFITKLKATLIMNLFLKF